MAATPNLPACARCLHLEYDHDRHGKCAVHVPHPSGGVMWCPCESFVPPRPVSEVERIDTNSCKRCKHTKYEHRTPEPYLQLLREGGRIAA